MTQQEKANIRASACLCKNYMAFREKCIREKKKFIESVIERLVKITGQYTLIDWKVYALRNKLSFVKLVDKAMSK